MAKETAHGRGITVFFDGHRCIHSRNCVLSHPDVFVSFVEFVCFYCFERLYVVV